MRRVRALTWIEDVRDGQNKLALGQHDIRYLGNTNVLATWFE
jgi:hypothetical protein